jgi:hypothetical protein
MTASPALLCRKSKRRDVLQEKNACRCDADRFNGIEYVEFEAGGSFDRIVVDFLCSSSRIKDFGLELWDETLRQEVTISERQPLSEKRVRVIPNTPLCAGRSYRLQLKRCQKVDPQFASYRFTTTPEVTDVDPKSPPKCGPRKQSEPQPNYLARDFNSFRQLLFDRIALLVPQWKERHVPDLGVTLIELLAYVGDYLSYFQDAVGTEAYLHTARQRISVRRHARLVDYQLHEGCNARTFLQVNIETEDIPINGDDAFFTTAHPDPKFADQVMLEESALERLPPGSFQPFEVMSLPALPSVLRASDVTNAPALIHFLAGGSESALSAERSRLSQALSKALPVDLLESLRGHQPDADERATEKLVEDLINALNDLSGQCCLHEKLGIDRHAKRDGARTGGRLGLTIRQENTDLLRAQLNGYIANQGVREHTLFQAHNCIAFYTWDQDECCIPVGATRATLRDEECSEVTRHALDLPPTVASAQRAGDGASGVPPSAESVDDPCDVLCTSQLHDWRLKNLSPGDVLIFEEILGPQTHQRADANPAHRQAVRLTRVRHCFDPINRQRIVEIAWDPADALRFPLCVSSIGPAENCCKHNPEISVARGNVLLVDHGLWGGREEYLGVTDYGPAPLTCHQNALEAERVAPPRSKLLRPVLNDADLTFASSLPEKWSATDAFKQKAAEALPSLEVFGFPRAVEPEDAVRDPRIEPQTLINLEDLDFPLDLFRRYPTRELQEQQRLEAILSPDAAWFLRHYSDPDRFEVLRSVVEDTSRGPSVPSPGSDDPECNRLKCEFDAFVQSLRRAVAWSPKAHLLSSRPEHQHVVVEMDDERRARLRFGDNELGRRPAADLSFMARYRRGNGVAGNIGAEAIKHVVLRGGSLGGIASVRNPLPAAGGTEPESPGHAKWHAPHAFKTLQRAITADDYAALVRRDFARRVQQAHASMHWTGSFYAIELAVDPASAVTDLNALLREIEDYLQRYRRIGHHMQARPPQYVGLQIDMVVCVRSGHLRAHVQRELFDRFSNRTLSDGTLGFFHPDKFTFGDALYLSRIVCEAKRVEGVENVDVTRFERYGRGDEGELYAGVMHFGPLEIPRLDNDCQRPEFGRFCLDVRGLR